ncbi:hypothetical protein C2G38_2196670 [Gigaspora rosea]|uniref:Uncharacterized protein n=1 Tax=Gigaspora rosea TaxID=44941 RepID=A0A397UWZ2_9GLOM|nr:hypothetical protein C2G38_2196670 [Gigaspora rosea]
MFQQKASDTIVSDLYIIEQIQGANVYDAKHKQVVSKKVKYANGFKSRTGSWLTIMDPLVTKHRSHPPTKRLKSSSKNQDHRESAHNQAIDPQDSNLKMPSQTLI